MIRRDHYQDQIMLSDCEKADMKEYLHVFAYLQVFPVVDEVNNFAQIQHLRDDEINHGFTENVLRGIVPYDDHRGIQMPRILPQAEDEDQ